MATQAKEMRTCRASSNSHSEFRPNRLSRFEKPQSGFEEKSHNGFEENLRIAIAVKLMLKMKNLFRLKDGQEPCLEDATDK